MCDSSDHVSVEESARNVVDVRRPQRDRGRRGRGAHSVDRDDNPLSTEGSNHRKNPALFFLGVDRGRPRARGFTTDIDDIRTGGNHRAGMPHRAVRVLPQATITERIGRHIENPEDQWLARHRRDQSVKAEKTSTVRSHTHPPRSVSRHWPSSAGHRATTHIRDAHREPPTLRRHPLRA